MLIRNVDQSSGLCNGTRLRITVLGKNFIKAVTVNGPNVDSEILIHKMDMNPSDSKLPFKNEQKAIPNYNFFCYDN